MTGSIKPLESPAFLSSHPSRSHRVKIFHLKRNVPIFRRLIPGRREVDMQEDIQPFIPDKIIDSA
jgi:hypothetical protein